ncbi:MAG: AAA family ATPase [Desulfatitalea sp.]
MYLSYYQLSAKPFQISADPRFLWLGDDHKEALANFRYGLAEGNGYVVLVGAVGTGKTTLVNALLATLDERVIVANINHPTLDVVEFLAFIARTYDPGAQVASKADCLRFFNAFLQRVHADGKSVLLVIDEAHRLSVELLEEIRLLSNIEQAGRKLINVFFVGQTELLHTLRSSPCRALSQRVTLFYHLRPLPEPETGRYVNHRLRVVGSDARLFTPKAVHAIHALSRGYPRLINKLCDRALLTGYVKEKMPIDSGIIFECAREIRLIDPMTRPLPRLSHYLFTVRPWVRLTAWRPRTAAVKAKFSATLKRAQPVAAALVAKLGAATRGAKRFLERTVDGLLKKRRATALVIAVTAAIALFVAGWMVIARSGPDTAATDVAERPQTAASEEPYILANLSAPAQPRPPDTAVGPLAAAPPAHPTSAAAVTAPTTVAPPSEPSSLEKAIVMLDRKDYQAAVALLEAESRSDDARSAEAGALYARALVGRADQLAAQSPDEAQALLHKAMAADPTNSDAPLQLGNLHTRVKQYTQAIEDYQATIRLNPQSAEALFNLGYIFASTGMYTDAEEMLARVVALKPAYQDKALFNLAVVQQKIGKRQESLAALEAAVAIRPDNQKAQDYLKTLKAADREAR